MISPEDHFDPEDHSLEVATLDELITLENIARTAFLEDVNYDCCQQCMLVLQSDEQLSKAAIGFRTYYEAPIVDHPAKEIPYTALTVYGKDSSGDDVELIEMAFNPAGRLVNITTADIFDVEQILTILDFLDNDSPEYDKLNISAIAKITKRYAMELILSGEDGLDPAEIASDFEQAQIIGWYIANLVRISEAPIIIQKLAEHCYETDKILAVRQTEALILDGSDEIPTVPSLIISFEDKSRNRKIQYIARQCGRRVLYTYDSDLEGKFLPITDDAINLRESSAFGTDLIPSKHDVSFLTELLLAAASDSDEELSPAQFEI